MAKDYKHRVSKKKASPKQLIGTWQWLSVAALMAGFVFFLIYLRITAPDEKPTPERQDVSAKADKAPAQGESKKTEAAADKKAEPVKPKPHFEFYTVLPNKETVVPDYELKTRAREELIGKAKDAKYIMQVGSFKTFKEADQLRAKLALMGIASKVDKATVDGNVLHRVKLGPYTQMKSVNDIRLRLKSMGANVIVTEMASSKPTIVRPPVKQQRQP
jgi:cell division protein FtsN